MRSQLGAVLVLAMLTTSCAGNGSPDDRTTSGRTSTRSADAETSSDDPEPLPSAQRARLEAGVDGFSRPRAMKHVRKLAGEIGVRVRATDAERRGIRYAARRFKRLGYNVKIQRFSVDGGTSRNVVAWWDTAKPYPFIVGAHMDTVPSSPGANDNASGVAVMLELARLFADRRQAQWVRFVAFGSEEYGTDGRHHVGSEVYVRRLGKKGRARLGGMLSVDMVADGRPLLVGNSGIAHDVVARTVHRKIERANIAVRYITLCDCSDHGPFERAGIPASFAYSGRESDYHSPSDTVPNMKPRDLLRTGRAVRAFLRTLDEAMIRRFRRH